MVCCLLELGLSLLPTKSLKKLFPPIVSSVTVMLIGVALTGTGMKYWGGGGVCADMVWQNHVKVQSAIADGYSFGPPFSSCTAGETKFGYGKTEYVVLGFSVLFFLVVIEL